MQRFFLLAGLFFGTAVAPAGAQDLLPSRFSSWSAQTPVVRSLPGQAPQLSPADAAILREDGLLDIESRDYARASRTLSVRLFRMKDPSGAYAAFTGFRTPEMVPADLARYAAIGRNRALVIAGHLLLDVRGLEGASPRDLGELVNALEKHADRAPFPVIASFLPARRRVTNSEKYVLGPAGLAAALGPDFGDRDWLGFSAGAEAVVARYRAGNRQSTLLLAEFPTPQAASIKVKELEAAFRVNPDSLGAAEQRPLPLFLRRKGSLLSIVAYPASPDSARALLDGVNYETHITWNEPSYTLKDPSFGSIIVGTFLGTGVILLFAVVAGIGFGGLRVLTKYFFPGKVFDRGAHVEILQLGLSSKPIQAKDFY